MKTNLAELACELQRDLDTRGVRRAFAESRGPDNIKEAYAVQRALRTFREARGEMVVGFKIGYTSPSVRKQLAGTMGLSESVHGYLWDTEGYPSGATVDYRRLGIEGELGVIIESAESDDVAQWEVAFEPIIELHMMGMDPSVMWDGPDADAKGRRGLELIGTNCIHAGVVHCAEQKRCRLGEVPLEALMKVHIGGVQIEQVTLMELEVDSVYGPVGTVSWLMRTLREEGHGDDGMVGKGTVLICSTPGGLYSVPPGTEVGVEFHGLTTSCVVGKP